MPCTAPKNNDVMESEYFEYGLPKYDISVIKQLSDVKKSQVVTSYRFRIFILIPWFISNTHCNVIILCIC